MKDNTQDTISALGVVFLFVGVVLLIISGGTGLFALNGGAVMVMVGAIMALIACKAQANN